jgi:diguanylate cyclase (GGDEF)-like protein
LKRKIRKNNNPLFLKKHAYGFTEREMEQGLYRNTKIIVVDDEVETLNLIKEYLSEKGINVAVAENGEKAMELIREYSYNIAILDLYLPDTTGLELLREISESYPKMQVIMITGYGTIHDAVECMKMGAADFTTKPLRLDHILLTINKLIEKTRLVEEAEMADYYRMLSHTDELTGLFNLRHLIPTLKREVERHVRYDHNLGVAMLDIDNFKKYNDTNGHEAGNRLLVNLAQTLRHNTRNCDLRTRYGGEEFVIVFPETTPAESSIVAQRICRSLENNLGITVTIGLASLPINSINAEELIKMADRAMYWGKRNGKNQIVVYSQDTVSFK